MVITGGINDRDLKHTRDADGKAAIIEWKMCRVQWLAYICSDRSVLFVFPGWMARKRAAGRRRSQEKEDLMRTKCVAFCCGVSFYEWKRVSERNVLLIA